MKKPITGKEVYHLDFNQELETDIFGHEVFIKRVPGGWIYNILWKCQDDSLRPTSIFVPFDNEFMVV